MKTLTFQIAIKAPAQTVYETIINEASSREWISVFSPNSYYTGSWNKGEKITFLTPDENGKMQGMICKIGENIPNKEILIQPYGVVQNEKELLEGEEVKDLDKTYERYSFIEQEGITTLHIEAVFFDKLEAFFKETWPMALKLIKEMCE